MKLNLVTWNLWNSFKQVNPIFEIEYLEPHKRILKRRQMQEEFLRSNANDVDLFFLQEVNPVQKRIKKWQNFYPFSQYQVDQGGLKVWGFGIPFGFENGLVFLSKHRLNFLKAIQLSPCWGYNSKYLSLQWQELRYALYCELYLYDKRILVVNTHLHHGIEWTKDLKVDLEVALQKKEISNESFEAILDYISHSTKRRNLEIENLMNEVESLRKHYNNIIIGGDFNISDDSPYLDIMKSYGFQSISLKPDFSWDAIKNQRNMLFSNQMPPPLKKAVDGRLLDILKEHNLRSRNIDHFFILGGIDFKNIKTFAEKENEHGYLASDHIGLQMEVEI